MERMKLALEKLHFDLQNGPLTSFPQFRTTASNAVDVLTVVLVSNLYTAYLFWIVIAFCFGSGMGVYVRRKRSQESEKSQNEP